MAVMRVEKNGNYTIMANYHLQDNRLSLKAKGLLSVMLALPPEWDYTLKGLTRISMEGISAIRAAILELEAAGYVTRARVRNEAGQLTDTEYTIYEFPQSTTKNHENADVVSEQPACESGKPALENPTLENPTLDKPTLDKPTLGNRTQLNTKEIKNTDTLNPYPSNINPSRPKAEINSLTQHQTSIQRKFCLEDLEKRIKEQIDYEDLIDRNDKDEIDDILSIMVEVMVSKCDHFTISGRQYPADLVYQRYSQINFSIVVYVLECMHKSGSHIRNIKQYLIAALFNAPATCESYYGAAVRRDLPFMRQ